MIYLEPCEETLKRFEDTLSAEYKEQLRNTSKPILIPAIINASNPINLTRHDLQKQWENLPNKPNLVYDPFGGSGTTMKVCKQNGIDCIISEIDKEKENTILSKVVLK